jgi:hypothetical protein
MTLTQLQYKYNYYDGDDDDDDDDNNKTLIVMHYAWAARVYVSISGGLVVETHARLTIVKIFFFPYYSFFSSNAKLSSSARTCKR